MSDVFLSYSRRDQGVVRRLHGALADAGREAWVDWQGIPPTAEWMAEVRAAVDAADAFVVVLSPDWAASPVCREEAEHAAARGKRIVPVVVRDTDAASVPERVAALNWIFLREGDDFGAGVATLLAALDLDLDWVHGHTRLLVRAGEWEARGRERSLLLRGRDLQAAEALLATAGAHRDPAPTPLQAEYVQAGREAERRSGRIRTGVLAAGMVGALVLAGFALLQLFRAEDQTRVAEDQTRLAQARELTAAADGQLTHDPELSVLLARQAANLWQDQDIDRTLRQALGASRIRGRFAGHEGEVRSVVYSADGTRLITSSLDGSVRIWDSDTRALLHKLLPAHGTPNAAVISPDGSYVAAGTMDGWVEVWTTATGDAIHAFAANRGQVTDLAFSPDGRTLVTTGDDAAARLWDTSTWRQSLSVPPVPGAQLYSVAFAGDGKTFATGGEDHVARVWDATTGALISKAVGHTGFIYGIALSPDGRRIATASQDETARVWDAGTGLQLTILRGNDDGVNALAFGLDGTTVATAGLDGTVRTWDAATGKQLSSITGHEGGVLDLAFDPRGDLLTTAGRDGTVRTWALEPFAELARYPGHSGAVLDGDFSPDGSRVVTAGADWTAVISDAMSGRLLTTLRGHQDRVRSARFSPDGARVLTASWDGTARIWDAETGAQLLAVQAGDEALSGAIFSPDGRSITTTVSGGKPTTWNATDGHAVMSFDPGAETSAVVYSPEGELLMTGDDGGNITEWDPSTGSKVRAWPAQDAAVVSMALDPTGQRLVSLGADGALKSWDTRTGKGLLSLRPGYGYGWQVAFSPDGTRVATGGDDGAAHVWDATSGELLAVIPADPRDVESVAFAPNGEDLLLTSRLSAPKLVHCDLCASPEAVLALADARVTRDFTRAERDRWLHETPPSAVPTVETPAPSTAAGGTGTPGAVGSFSPSAPPSGGPDETAPPVPTLALGALCSFDDAPCQLGAGHYSARTFHPAISFDLPADMLELGELPGSIAFALDNGNDIVLLDMASTYGNRSDSAIEIDQRRAAWLDYLRTEPRLRLGPLTEMTVDGHPATSLDVTSDDQDTFFVAYGDLVGINWTPGETMRFVFVDVGDGGLIIVADHVSTDPISDFEATVDALVASIRLTSSPPLPRE